MHRFYSHFSTKGAIICMNKPFDTFSEPDPSGGVCWAYQNGMETNLGWYERLGPVANGHVSVSVWSNDHF